MSKKYFVDSENVGDSWVDLYLNDIDTSEFYVFFTSKTPRIDYEHMVALMNTQKKQPEFIKCYEGNNALDFQLVSYIGSLLHDSKNLELIIVSNDTGYDAVIHFWNDRDVHITRIPTKDVKKTETVGEAKPVSEDVNISSAELVDFFPEIDLNDVHTVINCIGRKKAGPINSAFVHFYGQKKGNELYKRMKGNSFAAPDFQWKPEDKVKKFCELICKYCNDGKIRVPDDFPSYLYGQLTTKGRKTIANKVLAKYEKDLGQRLNKMFKPFYSIIVEIRKQ